MSRAIKVESGGVMVRISGTAEQCWLDEAEALARRWIWVLPSWCRNISVAVLSQDGNDGTLASAHSQPRYRQGWVDIFSGFWQGSPAERDRNFVHELLHIALAPLADYAKSVAPEGELEKERRADALEGVVVDLSWAITRAQEIARLTEQGASVDEMAALGVGRREEPANG